MKKKLLKTKIKKETFKYISNKKFDEGLKTLGEAVDIIVIQLKGGEKI